MIKPIEEGIAAVNECLVSVMGELEKGMKNEEAVELLNRLAPHLQHFGERLIAITFKVVEERQTNIDMAKRPDELVPNSQATDSENIERVD